MEAVDANVGILTCFSNTIRLESQYASLPPDAVPVRRVVGSTAPQAQVMNMVDC